MLAARAGLVLIIFSECSVLGEGDSRYTWKSVCCQVQAHESKYCVSTSLQCNPIADCSHILCHLVVHQVF
jgi:hypothetical protein